MRFILLAQKYIQFQFSQSFWSYFHIFAIIVFKLTSAYRWRALLCAGYWVSICLVVNRSICSECLCRDDLGTSLFPRVAFLYPLSHRAPYFSGPWPTLPSDLIKRVYQVLFFFFFVRTDFLLALWILHIWQIIAILSQLLAFSLLTPYFYTKHPGGFGFYFYFYLKGSVTEGETD